MSSPKPTIVITGGAGGIGTGFISQFLSAPQASHLHGIYTHHPNAAGSLASLLASKAPPSHTYELIPLDLSLQSNIHTFCTTLNARISSGELGKIKILMLIAGGIFTSKISDDGVDFTAEGVEMTFAVNYLANFALCTLLLRGVEEEGARIVFLSSTTHDPSFGSNGTYDIGKEQGLVFLNLADERCVKRLRLGSRNIRCCFRVWRN
jgi:NAD(P)-dependent dehydrogenase (short-subunit alcohol dehydrogenase family)